MPTATGSHSSQFLLDPLPPSFLDHDETAATLGQARPQVADQPVVLRTCPPICALVLDSKYRSGLACASRQLTQEIRIEAAICLLEKERTTFTPDEIAHPKLDALLLSLYVQPTGTLELLLAVEVADSTIEVLAEIEVSEAAVVITAGRVGMRMELKGVLICHCDSRFHVFAEQRPLERHSDRIPAQFTNARFQQVAQQQLLEIGAGQREALTAQKFGQPLGHECLLAGMRE